MAQHLRTIFTEDSVWRFNLDKMMYRRTPRSEISARSAVPYTFEWEPFEKLVRCDVHGEVADDGNHFLVHRPVPYGTGARRRTGAVIVDFMSTLTDNGEEVDFERSDLAPQRS